MSCRQSKEPGPRFCVTIALAAPACLRYFYLPSLARFRAAYPSIKLTILARSHADALSLVRSRPRRLGHGLVPPCFC